MKIDRIQAHNLLGIKDIDLRVTAPILFLAAANGGGKSSIADVVRMALARQAPRGYNDKRGWGILLNDQNIKAAGAVVSCDNDPEHAFGFSLPKVKFDGLELSDAMKVATDGGRFLAMTPAERRTLLFNVTGRGANVADTKDRLLAAKCDDKLVAEVLPILRGGFPDGHAYAADKAKEAKGQWRATTAATWGSVVAEAWAAPIPDAPYVDINALRQDIAALDDVISTQTVAMGAIQQAQRQAAADAQRRGELREKARRVPELEKLVPVANAERDEYQKKVEHMRDRAKGGKQGLVHDMARFIATVDIPALCDSATEEMAEALLKRYAAEHGDIADNAEPVADVAANMAEVENGLKVLTNRAANLQRDLDAARAAKAEYDALAPADDAVDASADLAEVQRLLTESKTARAQAVSALQSAEQALAAQQAAEAKTATAKAHHQTITAWLAIVEQLAPAGIPAQILAEALGPVNEKLAQASADTGWPEVTISDDMEVTITRQKPLPYQLESKSYQWRANAMIAAVVADISGLKILLLDEADILEPAARPELFTWLDTMVSEGDIDSAILCATLKQPPTDLLDTFQLAWIEGGAIAGAEQQAAA